MRAAFIPVPNISGRSERLRAGAITALLPENYFLGNKGQVFEWFEGKRGFLIQGEDTRLCKLDIHVLPVLARYSMPGEEIEIPAPPIRVPAARALVAA